MTDREPRDPAFATRRLILEPLATSHAHDLHAALDDPAVARHLLRPDVTTIDALRARIEQLATGPQRSDPGERWWNFAVALAADGTVIGRLEATTYCDWGEIAYVFGPRWWGHGYASEATRWLIEHLVAHGVAELWAAVHPANEPSKRLLARLGFLVVDAPTRPVASFDPGDAAFVWRA